MSVHTFVAPVPSGGQAVEYNVLSFAPSTSQPDPCSAVQGRCCQLHVLLFQYLSRFQHEWCGDILAKLQWSKAINVTPQDPGRLL